MPTYKDMDICLPVLKNKLNEERDLNRRTAIQIAINIIKALPMIEVNEGVICRDCYFYGKEQHVCRHKNGLHGRVLPKMYCSYGCEGDNDSGADEPTDDFSDFSEEMERKYEQSKTHEQRQDR